MCSIILDELVHFLLSICGIISIIVSMFSLKFLVAFVRHVNGQAVMYM